MMAIKDGADLMTPRELLTIGPKATSRDPSLLLVDDLASLEKTSYEAISRGSSITQGRRRYADVKKLMARFKARQAAKAEKEDAQLKRIQNCIARVKKELGVRRTADDECPELDHMGLGLNLVALDSHLKGESQWSMDKKDRWREIADIIKSASRTTIVDIFTGRKLIRFQPPYHILRRQKSPDEVVPWLNARMQMSSRAVQFGIPFDITTLTEYNIRTYLAKFCKITHERMVVYRIVFNRFKIKETNLLIQQSLPDAIVSLLYNCVTGNEVNMFLSKMGMNRPDIALDLQTFARVAAVAERILYLSYAEAAGTVPLGVVRTFQESADFTAFDQRIIDVHIDSSLLKLLHSL